MKLLPYSWHTWWVISARISRNAATVPASGFAGTIICFNIINDGIRRRGPRGPPSKPKTRAYLQFGYPWRAVVVVGVGKRIVGTRGGHLAPSEHVALILARPSRYYYYYYCCGLPGVRYALRLLFAAYEYVELFLEKRRTVRPLLVVTVFRVSSAACRTRYACGRGVLKMTFRWRNELIRNSVTRFRSTSANHRLSTVFSYSSSLQTDSGGRVRVYIVTHSLDGFHPTCTNVVRHSILSRRV